MKNRSSDLPRELKLQASPDYIPISISKRPFDAIFQRAESEDTPILAIVTGTKPDFYKQAPLVLEAQKQGVPTFIVNTGQHFDDVLGFGLKEFDLEKYAICNLHIRGNLMEKASELLLKFGLFGRFCSENYKDVSVLPIVHGDTLVAGIATMGWVFGVGQKVAQNEAGLRSMSPKAVKTLRPNSAPSNKEIQAFIDNQLYSDWFIAREEPFPEQIDTWVCSAGTQYFFAPVQLNRENLVREGYPQEDIHVVGNSVVDAINTKRKEKPERSIFDFYPQIEKGEWLRIDIHRRENLTERRFEAIISGVVQLVRKGYKIVFVKMNATANALKSYNLEANLAKLAEENSKNFVVTPLWREYANVVEFLDSGRCWAELTDSGSMQEELLYFPQVLSMTARLSTDRPETVFVAKSNILVPPVNSDWIARTVKLLDNNRSEFLQKKQIYGQPGEVSSKIISVIKKEFESGKGFFPWFHHRIGLWKDSKNIGYL
jgi:UDP-N-acetylglucosamine 2-epimerase (non-hydrolysing)